MSSCHRCKNRTEVSGNYKARSKRIVFPEFRINTNVSHVYNEDVQCCLKDISPESRLLLHENNVFERYEYQFLNYIMVLLENFSIIETKSLNDKIVSHGKIRRYDLLLTDGTSNRPARTVVLVEVDEKQHWLNKNEFEADRKREEELQNDYKDARLYILRIRVNETSAKSCVDKNKNGVRKSCFIKPQYSKQFENNMLAIREYIRKIFYKEEKHIYPHAYIDFAKNVGIEEFTGKFPVKKQKEETNELEQLITKIQNTKISDSCKVVIPKTGNICGRQRPCRYHDK